MRRVVGLFSFLILASGLSPARAADVSYTDLGKTPWARNAIVRTAMENEWLRVRGTLFGPTGKATRALLARAVVLAFPEPVVDPCPDPTPLPSPSWDPWWGDQSPSPSPEPSLPPPCVPPPPPVLPTFSDLTSGPAYRYGAEAVRRKLMTVRAGNTFDPSGPVTKAEMDRTLVRALEINDVITAIDHISSADGYRFRHSTQLAYGIIAARLHFHYNYPGTSADILPSTAVTRADLAYALNAATSADDWRLWSLQSFKELTLPKMDPTRRKVVEFALRYAEYPYVWGGTTSRGFDCSGFVWWVLKAGIGPSSRGYVGWPLGPRTSFEMARTASPRVLQRDLRVMDVILFDAAGMGSSPAWQRAGHAGLSLGNGWYIHSSGSNAGVAIDRLDRGMDYLWGRHVIR